MFFFLSLESRHHVRKLKHLAPPSPNRIFPSFFLSLSFPRLYVKVRVPSPCSRTSERGVKGETPSNFSCPQGERERRKEACPISLVSFAWDSPNFPLIGFFFDKFTTVFYCQLFFYKRWYILCFCWWISCPTACQNGRTVGERRIASLRACAIKISTDPSTYVHLPHVATAAKGEKKPN